MVVMARPAPAETGVTQERTASPSSSTVQAPQLNVVPVSPSKSRSAHSSGMPGSASTV